MDPVSSVVRKQQEPGFRSLALSTNVGKKLVLDFVLLITIDSFSLPSANRNFKLFDVVLEVLVLYSILQVYLFSIV